VSPERINVRAVLVGLAVALAVTVPVVLVTRVVVDDGNGDSGWAAVVAVTSIVAAGVGGFVTGRSEQGYPVLNGSIAGGGLYVVMRTIVSIASGEIANVVSLVLALLLYVSVGALGGALASMRRGGSREEDIA
jgi:putative membrane protein (TIGR04086 family)